MPKIKIGIRWPDYGVIIWNGKNEPNDEGMTWRKPWVNVIKLADSPLLVAFCEVAIPLSWLPDYEHGL
jgi:hypothetical protein